MAGNGDWAGNREKGVGFGGGWVWEEETVGDLGFGWALSEPREHAGRERGGGDEGRLWGEATSEGS